MAYLFVGWTEWIVSLSLENRTVEFGIYIESDQSKSFFAETLDPEDRWYEIADCLSEVFVRLCDYAYLLSRIPFFTVDSRLFVCLDGGTDGKTFYSLVWNRNYPFSYESYSSRGSSRADGSNG